MRQARHRHSQILAQRLTAKIGHPRKTLPWTDKLCHFVSFETTKGSPPSERQRSCVMRPRLCHALSRFPVANLAKRVGEVDVRTTSNDLRPRSWRPWPQKSPGCVMRCQGRPIRRLCQLCHATSTQHPSPKFGRAKLLLSRDQRAESILNHGSAAASSYQRSSVEGITHDEVQSVVSCAISENTERRLCHASEWRRSSPLFQLKICILQFAICNVPSFTLGVSCVMRCLSLGPPWPSATLQPIQPTNLMRHAEQQLTAI
ncbi:MAG: hypothetical protein JWP89_1015 [Schlesneria sp.]|nr:hypothetical protein [Schlesneria sp.]